MNKVATFKAKYLKDGHLSIPKEVVASLLLRRGEEVRVVIEKENLDKKRSLSLFGIWRDKSEEEIHQIMISPQPIICCRQGGIFMSFSCVTWL